MIDRALMNTIHNILSDCHLLSKFGEKHQMQTAVWMRAPVEQRTRLIKNGYVRCSKYVVSLTIEGLEVIGYRESLV